jgi:hypothetical protein
MPDNRNCANGCLRGAILPYPLTSVEPPIRTCRVARLTVGDRTCTAIAHQIEVNGKTELRLYLLGRDVSDAEAVGFRLPYS